ncbi:MAG: protein-L-isoaspartate O-methyltransferase [Marinosulfonomonas sp.]|nr:protein-L-isoaspartate O-methyltransferase [Marinosulfonomonas sp.]
MADFAARRTIMVDTQVRPSDVTKFPIIEAMLTIPREAFVPDQLREAAYAGENLDLGGGRVVLEPRTLGKMLDGLNIQPNELVLDLGCGLGYSSAVIARLAEAVIAVELPDQAEDAQRLLVENGADNVAVIGGNPTDGAAKHGPYDVIVLQGGAEQIPPSLLEQLKDGGRIGVIFMNGGLGICKIGYKAGGKVNWRFSFNATAPVVKGFEKQDEFTF